MPDDTQRTIQSVEKAFGIVEHLVEAGHSGPAALSDVLDMSRGTVHAYLRTLESLDLVVQDEAGYRLSLRYLAFGGHVRETIFRDVYTTAKPEIEELAATTGEKAQITVVDDDTGYILYQAHSDRAVRTDSHMGTRQPLHATAAGKAYLSSLDDETLDAVLDDDLPALTENTITDAGRLREDIDRIRETGVAYDRGERVDGIRCVAAPVETDDGESIGAISVSLPEYRWNDIDAASDLEPVVENTARVIGLNITYM
jgi:DNA-binding IclR family transcriptional regulator